MKNPLVVVFLSFMFIDACLALPETLDLADGRKLEHVTAVEMEHGKVKITHSSGIGRIPVESLAPASRLALGIAASDPAAPVPPDIKRLVTLDGKTYEDIRSLRVKPSFMSFMHRDGSASVRFEQIPEELRKQFGYDKATADAFDKAREQAEAAMRLAEENAAKMAAKSAMTAARRKSRARAMNMLYMTNYGSNSYWMSDPRQRGLMDAMMAGSLQEGGFSPDEARRQLDRARFR